MHFLTQKQGGAHVFVSEFPVNAIQTYFLHTCATNLGRFRGKLYFYEIRKNNGLNWLRMD